MSQRGASWALALLVACGEEPPAPTAAPPAPAPAPQRIVATMSGLGGLRLDTPPTIVGVVAALGEGWTARKGSGDLIEAQRDGQTVLTVVPAVNGTRITRVSSRSPDVVFPWDARVGVRIGDHKHWERMTCRLGDPAAPDGALCFAYEAPRFAYVVRGWSGDVAVLPPKAEVAELPIAELVWLPGSQAGG